MIRVSISREFTSTDTTVDEEIWEVEVDTSYNPDVVEDLVRRVVRLRDLDRRAMYQALRDDEPS